MSAVITSALNSALTSVTSAAVSSAPIEWRALPPGSEISDEHLLAHVREQAALVERPLTTADLADAVRAVGRAINGEAAARAVLMLREHLVGLGPLQKYVDMDSVTDVLVDGSGQIWTDGARGLTCHGRGFSGPDEVRELAVRLASRAGRRLDDAQPFVDAMVAGYRLHAVIPPVATEGTLISIRRATREALTLTEWCADSNREWLPLLAAIVAGRLNFLVSGGTGTGKTTLLSALLTAVPQSERLVIVEDTQELRPEHPHVVSLQCRTANVEGTGVVSLTDLVRNALRMRPDRLVVGECRGAEVGDFLSAMNTGHEGAGGTVHANNVESVPARLYALGALAGLDPVALGYQASSAIDVVIHMQRRAGQRYPAEIARLVMDEGRLHVESIAVRDASGTLRWGPGADWFRRILDEREVDSHGLDH